MANKKRLIAIVLGTRPEIIKMAPIIRHLHKTKRPYFVIHTGQHYSYEMDKLFFKELELPKPKYQLSIPQECAGSHAKQTAYMMHEIEKILFRERPFVSLAQGDTNSVLAASLVSAKIPGIRLGHVEAGLRSYDRQMPEEINRILSDHLADYLFVPTEFSKKTALKEGIAAKKIFVTGNTIVDAVLENKRIAERKVDAGKWKAYPNQKFFLMTMHRQENVDHKDRLFNILKGLDMVYRQYQLPILFPIHPRTTKRLQEFGLGLPKGIEILKPLGFLDFLYLESRARLILTDSGGVQEEACILKVPCVTLRTTTERPETVSNGSNLLAGYDPKKILSQTHKMMRFAANWRNPFGDGKTAERIVRILER